ncbi:hypothetical protein PISL3812_05220 [Talaromyces islandicus]|uniref:Transcriptional regulator n=1 Tax=Talaromyces islandicus TaxID=28573 RepID=A0A0U1LXV6_TALIS|nr:hypothetical protein PISL3812_05220 [Talaromyces islandicus]
MPPRYAFYDSSDEETGETDNKCSDERLEKGLRDTVASIFRSGKLEELTVKRVRLATETTLGLEEGFFKAHQEWKPRSETVIKEEAAAQDQAQDNEQESDEAPKPTTSSVEKRKKPTKTKAPQQDDEGPSKAKKRRKTTKTIESDDEDQEGTKAASSLAEESADQTPASVESEKDDHEASVDKGAGDESESEMSVVLEEPAPKKQQKPQKKSSGPAPKKAKAKPKAASESDPDQAEIKRLQGWLLKCGIRKFWARELAPYDTPKAKIKHLKSMLEEVGMKGRYSIEKARQIRDARELQADLEAVKEGAMKWGTEGTPGADDGSDGEKPRRRLVKGRQSLAFLSDDGEETD